MTRDKRPTPMRWLDQRRQDQTLDDRAATLIRDSLAPGDPDEACLARIRDRIVHRPRKRVRHQLAFRLALAGAAFVAGLATVRAYELARKAGWLGPPSSPAAPMAPKSPPSPRHSRHLRHADPSSSAPSQEGLTVPVEEPSRPEPVALAPAAPMPASPSVPLGPAPTPRPGSKDGARQKPNPDSTKLALLEPQPTEVATVPAPDNAPRFPSQPQTRSSEGIGATEEVQALKHALALLRREHNPGAALSALDAYLARYPRSVLHGEARLARIDALLALRRTDDALAALESVPLEGGRRLAELLVVRAELRARANCSRAEEDFTAALSHSPDARLLERILYGRGSCRARLGDAFGATADLRRYVERFPNGIHAKWARDWLEKSTP